MLPLPPEIVVAYDAILARRKIAADECNDYRKWLRYYLDYCHKYHVSPANKLSFSTFHKKLSSKNQSEALCRQAHAAVVLYHEMLRANHKPAPPQTSDQTQGKKNAIDRNQAVTATADMQKPGQASVLRLFPCKVPLVGFFASINNVPQKAKQGMKFIVFPRPFPNLAHGPA